MGYTTEFKGVLKIQPELTASQIVFIEQFLREDIRWHPDWNKNEWSEKLMYSIDLELTPEYDGLVWTGIEKSYEMCAQVNYVITQMKTVCPEFRVSGKFAAQGERLEDRWELVIGEDGFATEVKLTPKGKKFTCPECDHDFFAEEVEV